MQISWTYTFIWILEQKTENDIGKQKFDTKTTSSFIAVACMHAWKGACKCACMHIETSHCKYQGNTLAFTKQRKKFSYVGKLTFYNSCMHAWKDACNGACILTFCDSNVIDM